MRLSILHEPYHKRRTVGHNVLGEAFTPSDFYDFYALMYASTDAMFTSDDEVQRRAHEHARYLLAELLDEFTVMILGRFANPYNQETRKWMIEFGLPIVKIKTSDDVTAYNESLKNISLDERISAIEALAERRLHGNMAGDTWWELAGAVVAASRASGHRRTVYAVDKLLNLAHHGGFITDYLEEVEWLPNALNYRDNATPQQIMSRASSDIRNLIGRAVYGAPHSREIPELKLLATMVRRVAAHHPDVDVTVDNSNTRITIVAPATLYLTVHNGQRYMNTARGRFYAGGVNRLAGDQYCEPGYTGVGHVTVTSNDGGLTAVDQYGNTIELHKPFDYNTAESLLRMALSAIHPDVATKSQSIR